MTTKILSPRQKAQIKKEKCLNAEESRRKQMKTKKNIANWNERSKRKKSNKLERIGPILSQYLYAAFPGFGVRV